MTTATKVEISRRKFEEYERALGGNILQMLHREIAHVEILLTWWGSGETGGEFFIYDEDGNELVNLSIEENGLALVHTLRDLASFVGAPKTEPDDAIADSLTFHLTTFPEGLALTVGDQGYEIEVTEQATAREDARWADQVWGPVIAE